MSKKRYRWWHGVLFYVEVQAVRLAFRAAAKSLTDQKMNERTDREYYQAERLPVFAPPGIAFPIAWGINSISSIAGGLYVLNLPAETKGRKQFLRQQAVAWMLFALFDAAFFALRSPINAALVTFTYSAVTFESLYISVQTMHEPRATASLAITAAWLMLANPVGAAQAAWNYDPFWNVGPLAEPPKKWLKRTPGVSASDPD